MTVGLFVVLALCVVVTVVNLLSELLGVRVWKELIFGVVFFMAGSLAELRTVAAVVATPEYVVLDGLLTVFINDA